MQSAPTLRFYDYVILYVLYRQYFTWSVFKPRLYLPTAMSLDNTGNTGLASGRITIGSS